MAGASSRPPPRASSPKTPPLPIPSARQLYKDPRHPYTRGLMDSVPRLDGDTERPLVPIDGQPPDLATLPPGCAFAPRCRQATERCHNERPPLVESAPHHFSACFFHDRLAA